MEECPVCGEELYENRDTKIVTRHQEQQYQFCSTEHRDKFEEQPGEYQ